MPGKQEKEAFASNGNNKYSSLFDRMLRGGRGCDPFFFNANLPKREQDFILYILESLKGNLIEIWILSCCEFPTLLLLVTISPNWLFKGDYLVRFIALVCFTNKTQH